MSFKKLTIYIFCLFFSIKAYGASISFPSTLTADTTGFVLVSNSGTTPAISGFSTDVFVVVTGTAGSIKIVTYAGLEQRTGYCGYTADSTSEPEDCAGNSINATDGIGFEGSQAEVNTALATLSYKGDGTTSSVSITASATPTGASYNKANGHYYKHVAATNVDFTVAQTAAASAAQKYNGLTGYLVTITSAAENAFVFGKTTGDAWIGASDDGSLTENTHAEAEGTWEWVAGPEDGETFHCQAGTGDDAEAAHGDCTVGTYNYVNWDPQGAQGGEPNDFGDGARSENCAHIRASDGEWNDYLCTNDAVDAYIIEYGGMGGTATIEVEITLTITSTESTAGFTIFDVELKTMIKAQIEASNRIVDASTEPILNRINQPRKISKSTKIKKKRKNKHSSEFKYVKFNLLTIQKKYPRVIDNYDIDFYKTYLYDEYLELFNKLDINNQYPLISALPITSHVYTNELPYKYNDIDVIEKITIDEVWSAWTSGSVTIGERQFKIGKLGSKSESDGISFGFDRGIGKNGLFGIAFREGKDNTDVGNKGTKVDIKSKNITTYTSFRSDNKNSLDVIFGLGHLDNDLTRKETSSSTNTIKGSRTADQIYGIINFDMNKDIGSFKTSYYSRIEQSYSKLYAYSENSNDSAAHFRDQHLTTSIISLGTAFDYVVELDNGGSFSPNALFEYASDKSDSSKAVAYYLSDPESEYNFEAINDIRTIYTLGTGFDLNILNSWNINSKILRKIYKNEGHENKISLTAVKSF